MENKVFALYYDGYLEGIFSSRIKAEEAEQSLIERYGRHCQICDYTLDVILEDAAMEEGA